MSAVVMEHLDSAPLPQVKFEKMGLAPGSPVRLRGRTSPTAGNK